MPRAISRPGGLDWQSFFAAMTTTVFAQSHSTEYEASRTGVVRLLTDYRGGYLSSESETESSA